MVGTVSVLLVRARFELMDDGTRAILSLTVRAASGAVAARCDRVGTDSGRREVSRALHSRFNAPSVFRAARRSSEFLGQHEPS